MNLQQRIHNTALLGLDDVDRIFQRARRDIELNPYQQDSDGNAIISISVLEARVGFYAEQVLEHAQLYVDLEGDAYSAESSGDDEQAK